jgi:HPr kinase/phosphorylase
MTGPADLPQIIHATTVDVCGRGVIILGGSGQGKSSLALQLIALGAGLVADDRTILARSNGRIIATAPDTIAGKIEARGVGILTLPHIRQTEVFLAVDMDRAEHDRLPQMHETVLAGISLPCLHRVDTPHFSAAIFLYLQAMKSAHDD